MHPLVAHFMKGAHHLKPMHKPVIPLAEHVLGGRCAICGFVCNPQNGWFSTFLPIGLPCIWQSNQPKGYVIYMHCHFNPPAPPHKIYPRSLCNLIRRILSSLSYEVLAVDVKTFSPLHIASKEKTRLPVLCVCIEYLHHRDPVFTLM